MNPEQLRPGDVLLYTAKGFYEKVIFLKTWHPIAHVEVFIGNGKSVASRNGIGVGEYPFRAEGLTTVMRPKAVFQLGAAMDVFRRKLKGLPYGWLDLLQFLGFNVNTKGVVCSDFATQFLRAGAIPVFNQEPAEKIAPFQFSLSEELEQVWP